MTKPKLTYFDAPVSRGEECRLALRLAGVDFEDVRVKPADWPALKATTPYGTMPFFEIPGKGVIGQSNAILVHLGRRHGLHPKDDFEAARHEAMMQHVEDLRLHVTPTMRIKDEAEKKKAREALAETYLPAWAACAEKNITGPFFAGPEIHVVDLKLYMIVRWFVRGAVDHVPTTIFASFPKLTGVHAAVEAHPKLAAYLAKTG